MDAPRPSYDRYLSDIQSVVATHCAFLPCHGNPHRSLTLYAVGFLRAQPLVAGTALEESDMTEAELLWNYDALRLRLIDASPGEEPRLLKKCLPPASGGIQHASVVVFPDRTDPDFVTLQAWIAEAL